MVEAGEVKGSTMEATKLASMLATLKVAGSSVRNRTSNQRATCHPLDWSSRSLLSVCMHVDTFTCKHVVISGFDLCE